MYIFNSDGDGYSYVVIAEYIVTVVIATIEIATSRVMVELATVSLTALIVVYRTVTTALYKTTPVTETRIATMVIAKVALTTNTVIVVIATDEIRVNDSNVRKTDHSSLFSDGQSSNNNDSDSYLATMTKIVIATLNMVPAIGFKLFSFSLLIFFLLFL